ncbi:MAG: pilus assembly PilX N-terminal domain-containing protein [Planctomycetota bacterium]|jgi:hypothetical protein
MKRGRKCARQKRAAAVLIISMIFVVVFSALAVSMATLSGNNVQLASNHHNLNAALSAAQSGQEVMRYWLSGVLISSSTPQDQYLSAIITAIQDDFKDNCVGNVAVGYCGSVPKVVLDSTTGVSFDSVLNIDTSQPTVLQVSVTGRSGPASRTITTSYNIQRYEFPIFNFGLATKGPLNFPGNPTVAGVNSAWEADIFVESPGSAIAVQVIGNTDFDGEVNIANAASSVDFQNDVLIAGDQGQTAIDNHVHIGVDSPEFPVPDTERFRQYAIGDLVDSSTDLSKGITLTNAIVKGGTNPVFDGSVTIKGILFIESPNKVTFGNNVGLQGIIVADGDVDNPDPGSNSIDILGNFASQSYPDGMEFDLIRQEEGSSIIAPGFHTTFAGNFSTLEGVVAVSGAHFAGNMNAEIKGTIINYSDSATVVEGNASMNFDRVNSTKVPAGFDLYRELDYEPASYSETGS